MTNRVWTREELDQVWELPDEPDHWEWMENGRTPEGVQLWAAVVLDYDYGDPEVASIVYVNADGWPCCECSADHKAQPRVVLAVIGARLGHDSPEWMARKLDEAADESERARQKAIGPSRPYHDGQVDAYEECAEMLRRGRVHEGSEGES